MKSLFCYLITTIGIIIGIIALIIVVPPGVVPIETSKISLPVQEKVYIKYPTPRKGVPLKYIAYLVQECKKYNVPYLLVFKLIERESEWKSTAKGVNKDTKTGKIKSVDHGYFQINSSYFKEFIERYKDPERTTSSYDLINNPYDNAEIGIKYLESLYNQFGNWSQAVQAYNGGARRVREGNLWESILEYQKFIIPVDKWWEFPPTVVIIRDEMNS